MPSDNPAPTPSLPKLQPGDYDVFIPIERGIQEIGYTFKTSSPVNADPKTTFAGYVKNNPPLPAATAKAFHQKGDVFSFAEGQSLIGLSEEDAEAVLAATDKIAIQKGFAHFRMRDEKFAKKSVEQRIKIVVGEEKKHVKLKKWIKKERARLVALEKVGQEAAAAAKQCKEEFLPQANQELEKLKQELNAMDVDEDDSDDEEEDDDERAQQEASSSSSQTAGNKRSRVATRSSNNDNLRQAKREHFVILDDPAASPWQ